MEILIADMKACPVRKAPDTWEDSFLEDNDPVRLERLGGSMKVCHFPQQDGKAVLKMETVKSLIGVSNHKSGQFHFGIKRQEELWNKTMLFEKPFPAEYKDKLTLEQYARKSFQSVESLIPRLFAVPADKNFYLFKSPASLEPEFVKLECKSLVGRVTVYHFSMLSAEDSYLINFMGHNSREYYKREIIFFLANYIEKVGQNWNKLLFLDPVILSCKVTFAVVDTIALNKVYKVTAVMFNLFKRLFSCYWCSVRSGYFCSMFFWSFCILWKLFLLV